MRRLSVTLSAIGERFLKFLCLTLLLIVLPCTVTAGAESGHVSGAATWRKGSQTGQAELSIQLVKLPAMGPVTALQVNVALTAQDLSRVKSAEFTFDSRWSGLIRECVYDDSRGLLSIVIAGNSEILEQENIHKLGVLKVQTSGAQQELSAVVAGGEVAADGQRYQITFVQESEITLFRSSQSSESSGGGSGGHSYPDRVTNGGGSRGVGPTKKGLGGVYQSPQAGAIEIDGDWELTGDAWKYKLASGTYAKDTWIYVGGLWYHIGPDSLMDTGWYLENGTWYFLRPDGHMKMGWLDLNGVWYYLEPVTGKMRTGWLYDGGWWYYFTANGDMCCGWQTIDGKQYYFNPTAPVPVKALNAATGKMEETTAGQRPLGAMYAAATTPDGYQVDSVGVLCQTGQSAPATGTTPVSPTVGIPPVSPAGTTQVPKSPLIP